MNFYISQLFFSHVQISVYVYIVDILQLTFELDLHKHRKIRDEISNIRVVELSKKIFTITFYLYVFYTSM